MRGTHVNFAERGAGLHIGGAEAEVVGRGGKAWEERRWMDEVRLHAQGVGLIGVNGGCGMYCFQLGVFREACH
jgi:hypothetical protein